MNARRAATELLVAVEAGQALDDALNTTHAYAELEGRDRAFARALATATLRRLGGIDAVLSRFMQRPLPTDAAHARNLLRVGAAQLLVLNTPAHAAVGETVETANAMREARGFAKLMNAVLRRVSREGAEILASLPPGANLPAWLYTRWRASYGDEAARMAEALLREAPLDLSAKGDAQAWAQPLFARLTPTNSLRFEATAPIDSLPGFAEGAWWVQDAAAALPARMLGDVSGKRVLDLCAAPGGKTLQLAAAGADVTAVDKSAPRLERLKENLARTKLSARVLAGDVLKFRDDPYDAILLDAPCSSTGTLRRHPDVAWHRRPDDIRVLADLQGKLLATAAKLLKPGAPLVYAVCSLEPEEGPGVIAQALQNGWKRAPLTPDEMPGAETFITPEGDLRTKPSDWPDIGGLDGFFAARLVRA